MTLPGITTGNVATKSLTDSEAVQCTLELLSQTTHEFRVADMRKKLKECQGIRSKAYQHMRDYVEGDKVWYQPLNGNSWLGPASVLCQRGQSVWLHTNGDIKKVAACKVRPYELIDNQDSQDSQDSKHSHSQSKKKKVVMLEDGLADMKDIHYVENYWTGLIEEEKDCIGARYLKVVNHMY